MELQVDASSTLLVITASLGLISLARTLLRFVTWTWIVLFRPPKNLKQYGSWALITGSTDGIGKALAFELASKGLNLVLVGRNPSKLDATSHEIKLKHGPRVDVRTVVIDFASCRGPEISNIIERETKGLDLGILINNAGLAYPYARFLHEVDPELLDGVLRVNVEATTWITKTVVSKMLRKKRGAIVNIGSGSSSYVSSYPLYSLYAATKSYVAMFSKSISMEYKHQGIDVQCQIPMLVATKMASIRKSSLFIPSPETYSKATTRWIGYEHVCTPYWPHALQVCLIRALPERLLDWCLLKYFLGMRKRGQ